MELVDLGFCPRCKVELEETLTAVIDMVLFCSLCRPDMIKQGESPDRYVQFAIKYNQLKKPIDSKDICRNE